jgi:hypothetical protein
MIRISDRFVCINSNYVEVEGWQARLVHQRHSRDNEGIIELIPPASHEPTFSILSKLDNPAHLRKCLVVHSHYFVSTSELDRLYESILPQLFEQLREIKVTE